MSYALDLEEGEVGHRILSSNDFGGNLGTVAVTHGERMVLSHEDEKTGRWSIYCSELNGDNLVTAGDWPGEPIAMEVIRDDLVLVSMSERGLGWTEVPSGLMSLDPESCTANESSDWIRASRDVVGMAAFGL